MGNVAPVGDQYRPRMRDRHLKCGEEPHEIYEVVWVLIARVLNMLHVRRAAMLAGLYFDWVWHYATLLFSRMERTPLVQ